jgi:alanine racemase
VRWAWAEIDLGALAHNVGVVLDVVAPAEVWAVVKADGYGHGVIAVATTALDAGATGLCVALVDEGIELRRAGIAAPVLVLSEQPAEQAETMVGADLTPTVYSRRAVAALAGAADAAGRVVGVHVKIDTGMHRVGASPQDALALVDMIAASRALQLAGIFTHLARADEPEAAANAQQLQRFDDVVAAVRAAGHVVPLVHAANSAAALALPSSRHDVVRLGIAMYGIEPAPGVADRCADLLPALALKARVSMVKRVAAGEGISYGLRHRFERDTTVATVPIGYADGVRRGLSDTGGEVLLHGRRVPIVGVVTMDQLMVDCGALPDPAAVAVGDEVVLLGTQRGEHGTETIRVEEWASRLGTIGYEVVCGLSKRIERVQAPSPSA